MSGREREFTLLLAEDDDEDCMLVRDALGRTELRGDLRCVCDGAELMEYLHRRGAYADPLAAPRPDLILLDLHMPKKDGRAVLAEIKSDPRLRRIPVVVLTTSKAEEDIGRSYDLGANSFIVKPKAFHSLIDVMRNIIHYWVDTVALPPEPDGAAPRRSAH